jgi:hypothetical protein
MMKFYVFLFLTFIGLGASAQTVITLKNISTPPCNVVGTGCDWNTATNWDLNRIPGNNDIVVIPSGHRVNLTGNNPSSGAFTNMTIRIFGTLALGNGAKLTLDANSKIAAASGATEIIANPGAGIKVGGSPELSGGTTKTGPFIHDNDGFRDGSGTYPFVAGDEQKISQTLPVKLTSFTATTSNDVVNIKWETAQENNNKEFELQRSANGKDWTNIATVAGKGTTELKSNYAHTDRAPLRGVSLYRLKQIDYDGKNEISQVVAVKVGENGRFAFDVTPNLVVNNFKVVASEDLRSSEISIFNTVGNRMNAVVNRNGNEANVDVSNLPSGQYIIRIQNGTEALTKRFVVNK